MSSLRKLFYISRRQKLPRLRHHLTNGREMDIPDEESQILLEGGIMRDWMEARHLMKTRKQSALTLFWQMTKKPKADWKKRLKRILVRWVDGGYPYDPHKRELKELDGYDTRPW